MMDTDKLVQGLTVGIVAGLAVYWLTSRKKFGGNTSDAEDYKPLYGDVRSIRGGVGTCADCQCCGLMPPSATPTPLAADYLCSAPPHAAAVSNWALGVSIQVTCEGFDLDSVVHRQETSSTFPVGVRGPDSVPSPVAIPNSISCHPEVCGTVDCVEII
jgi:hypothetical protein